MDRTFAIVVPNVVYKELKRLKKEFEERSGLKWTLGSVINHILLEYENKKN